MRYFFSIVFFTLAPLFGAAEQYNRVNIETDRFVIEGHYEPKEGLFGVYLKTNSQERQERIGMLPFSNKDGSSYSCRLRSDLTGYQEEACIALTKQIYEPLFGRRIGDSSHPLTSVICVNHLLLHLPTVSLLDGGFQFSHAKGWEFYFVYQKSPVSLSAEDQQEFKTALELLAPKLSTYKSLSGLIGAPLTVDETVNSAIDHFAKIIKGQVDLDTKLSLLLFLSVIVPQWHPQLTPLFQEYAPQASSRAQTDDEKREAAYLEKAANRSWLGSWLHNLVAFLP